MSVGSVIVALYRMVHGQRVEEWPELVQAVFVAISVAVLAVLSLRLANRFSLKWVSHVRLGACVLLCMHVSHLTTYMYCSCVSVGNDVSPVTSGARVLDPFVLFLCSPHLHTLQRTPNPF